MPRDPREPDFVIRFDRPLDCSDSAAVGKKSTLRTGHLARHGQLESSDPNGEDGDVPKGVEKILYGLDAEEEQERDLNNETLGMP